MHVQSFLIIFSLLVIDFVMGHGFMYFTHRTFCKLVCFVRKSIKLEAATQTVIPDVPISFPTLLVEVLVLSITVGILNRYKHNRARGGEDRIDHLLRESSEALRQTNEFLEKWRLRRIKWNTSKEASYLDEEPQVISPLKIEVPILHMAIVDTLGTTRSRTERGDAGDTCNVTDSTIISYSPLDDESLSLDDNTPEEMSTVFVSTFKETNRSLDLNSRYLWDVMEEDNNAEE